MKMPIVYCGKKRKKMQILSKINKYVYLLSLLLIASLSKGQSVAGSFQHDGITRSYTIYIPANYTVVNMHPVVFNLHGYTSNGSQQAAMTKMNAIADTAGFIVAYPEGTLDASLQQYWNSGYGTGVDDVGFIDALIDTIANNYSVNLQRIYSTGMSNGGIMSNTLACELNGRIAAIAGVAGTMSLFQQTTCSPANKIPVMQIQGTSDLVVPYLGNVTLMGVDALLAHWRTNNNLTSASSITSISNINLFDGSTAELIKYDIGSAFPVHLFKVTNGGHSWPGSGVIVSGTTNMDFNASLEIWKFFSQYSLITSVNQIKGETSSKRIKLVGANPVQNQLQWESDFLSDYTIKIYNTMGQEMWSSVFSNKKMESLSIQKFPQGAYLMVCSTSGEVCSLKFVKE
jgi:polyhydroxybutyrate depolymerase